MPDSGMGISSLSIISRNRSRSSARSMTAGRGAQDLHAVFLQLGSQIERRLAAELRDDAQGLLFLIDAEDVFQGQRLEIQLVGRIVVCGNRLRVAVYDDGLKAQLLESESRVYAAVVKLNSLSDPVRDRRPGS